MIPPELEGIAEKYKLPFFDDADSVAQLCFTSILHNLIKKVKQKNPSIIELLQNKPSLTIVDVGCGYFRYGRALHAVLSTFTPDVRLFPVDKIQLKQEYTPGTFIKSTIAKAAPKLAKHKVQEIDLFTVFNPFPGIPNLTGIPKEMRDKAFFLGCVDWNPTLFKESLAANHFEAVAWKENCYHPYMREWYNNYDPFVFAMPKQP